MGDVNVFRDNFARAVAGRARQHEAAIAQNSERAIEVFAETIMRFRVANDALHHQPGARGSITVGPLLMDEETAEASYEVVLTRVGSVPITMDLFCKDGVYINGLDGEIARMIRPDHAEWSSFDETPLTRDELALLPDAIERLLLRYFG